MCDQKFNILFVEEIKKRPLLYNTSLPQYTRRDLTEAAWDEVGKTMMLTGAACKERWKNLRTVYSRHMKRLSEEPSEKRKKYYLMDHMSFILPYMHVMRCVSSNYAVNSQDTEDASGGIQQDLNGVHYSESLDDSCPDHDEETMFPFVRIKPDPSDVGEPVDDQSSHDAMITGENSRDPEPRLIIEKRSYSKMNYSGQNAIGEGKSENRRSVDPNVLEVRRMFLLGLVDEVASMTDAQMRSFKRRVLKLIDEVMEN